MNLRRSSYKYFGFYKSCKELKCYLDFKYWLSNALEQRMIGELKILAEIHTLDYFDGVYLFITVFM